MRPNRRRDAMNKEEARMILFALTLAVIVLGYIVLFC